MANTSDGIPPPPLPFEVSVSTTTPRQHEADSLSIRQPETQLESDEKPLEPIPKPRNVYREDNPLAVGTEFGGPPGCPYEVGTFLDLEISIENNDKSSLRACESQVPTNYKATIHVVIDHVYLPFTLSQVMRVRVISAPESHDLELPETLILKLYDRRYIADRRYDEQTWSLEREIAAQRKWNDIAQGKGLDDYEEVKRLYDEYDEDDWRDMNHAWNWPDYEEKTFQNNCEVISSLFLDE